MEVGRKASSSSSVSPVAEGGSPASSTANASPAVEGASPAASTANASPATAGGSLASPTTGESPAAEGGSPEAGDVESPAAADEAEVSGLNLGSDSDEYLLFDEQGTYVPFWLSTIEEVSEDCHDTFSRASCHDTASLASLMVDSTHTSAARSKRTSCVSGTSPSRMNGLLTPPGTSPPKINGLLDFSAHSPRGSSLPPMTLNVAYTTVQLGHLDEDDLKNPKWVAGSTEFDCSSPMGPVEIMAWAHGSPEAEAVREAHPDTDMSSFDKCYYKIEVKTDAVPASDAGVRLFVELIGTKGRTSKMLLANGIGNTFDECKYATFLLEDNYIGDYEHLSLSCEARGSLTHLHIEYIAVVDATNGTTIVSSLSRINDRAHVMGLFSQLCGCVSSSVDAPSSCSGESSGRAETGIPAHEKDDTGGCYVELISCGCDGQSFNSCGVLHYPPAFKRESATREHKVRLGFHIITPDRLACLEPDARDELTSRLVMLDMKQGRGPLAAQSGVNSYGQGPSSSMSVAMAVADAVQWSRAAARKTSVPGSFSLAKRLINAAPRGGHTSDDDPVRSVRSVLGTSAITAKTAPPWLFLEPVYVPTSALGRSTGLQTKTFNSLERLDPAAARALAEQAQNMLGDRQPAMGGAFAHTFNFSQLQSDAEFKLNPLISGNVVAMQVTQCYMLNPVNGLLEPSLLLDLVSGRERLPQYNVPDFIPRPVLDTTLRQPSSVLAMDDKDRGRSILDSIPIMATLISAECKSVLYQNFTSCSYWGDLREAPSTFTSVDWHPLNMLFRDRQDDLNNMWAALRDGTEWRGVLKVPSLSSSRHTASHRGRVRHLPTITSDQGDSQTASGVIPPFLSTSFAFREQSAAAANGLLSPPRPSRSPPNSSGLPYTVDWRADLGPLAEDVGNLPLARSTSSYSSTCEISDEACSSEVQSMPSIGGPSRVASFGPHPLRLNQGPAYETMDSFPKFFADVGDLNDSMRRKGAKPRSRNCGPDMSAASASYLAFQPSNRVMSMIVARDRNLQQMRQSLTLTPIHSVNNIRMVEAQSSLPGYASSGPLDIHHIGANGPQISNPGGAHRSKQGHGKTHLKSESILSHQVSNSCMQLEGLDGDEYAENVSESPPGRRLHDKSMKKVGSFKGKISNSGASMRKVGSFNAKTSNSGASMKKIGSFGEKTSNSGASMKKVGSFKAKISSSGASMKEVGSFRETSNSGALKASSQDTAVSISVGGYASSPKDSPTASPGHYSCLRPATSLKDSPLASAGPSPRLRITRSSNNSPIVSPRPSPRRRPASSPKYSALASAGPSPLLRLAESLAVPSTSFRAPGLSSPSVSFSGNHSGSLSLLNLLVPVARLSGHNCAYDDKLGHTLFAQKAASASPRPSPRMRPLSSPAIPSPGLRRAGSPTAGSSDNNSGSSSLLVSTARVSSGRIRAHEDKLAHTLLTQKVLTSLSSKLKRTASGTAGPAGRSLHTVDHAASPQTPSEGSCSSSQVYLRSDSTATVAEATVNNAMTASCSGSQIVFNMGLGATPASPPLSVLSRPPIGPTPPPLGPHTSQSLTMEAVPERTVSAARMTSALWSALGSQSSSTYNVVQPEDDPATTGQVSSHSPRSEYVRMKTAIGFGHFPHRSTGSLKGDTYADGDESDDEDAEEEEEEFCWHEVHALPTEDPAYLILQTDITTPAELEMTKAEAYLILQTDISTPAELEMTKAEAYLILQTDISTRAELEMRMAELTEAQLTMLENMFPRHVLEYMVAAQEPNSDMTALAFSHSNITIMFMDIVGFTNMSKEVTSQAVMGYLNELFTLMDDLVDQYGVYKVDTAGDCYIVAGGLMNEDSDGLLALDPDPEPNVGARKVLAFTQALMQQVPSVLYPHTGEPTVVRVGIHTGSCVSGLIGTKLPKFSLWGDTMNTASRMESTAKPGYVQVSEATLSQLDEQGREYFKPTGGVQVKGKGIMQTYTWYPPNDPERADSNPQPQVDGANSPVISRVINSTHSWLSVPNSGERNSADCPRLTGFSDKITDPERRSSSRASHLTEKAAFADRPSLGYERSSLLARAKLLNDHPTCVPPFHGLQKRMPTVPLLPGLLSVIRKNTAMNVSDDWSQGGGKEANKLASCNYAKKLWTVGDLSAESNGIFLPQNNAPSPEQRPHRPRSLEFGRDPQVSQAGPGPISSPRSLELGRDLQVSKAGPPPQNESWIGSMTSYDSHVPPIRRARRASVSSEHPVIRVAHCLNTSSSAASSGELPVARSVRPSGISGSSASRRRGSLEIPGSSFRISPVDISHGGDGTIWGAPSDGASTSTRRTGSVDGPRTSHMAGSIDMSRDKTGSPWDTTSSSPSIRRTGSAERPGPSFRAASIDMSRGRDGTLWDAPSDGASVWRTGSAERPESSVDPPQGRRFSTDPRPSTANLGFYI
eukprot:gene5955-33531_t